MEKKNLADAVLPSVEERYEWQSFLGLLPVLDLSAVDPVRYQRCMRAVWELREKVTITRSALMDACGLAFHDSSLESDLPPQPERAARLNRDHADLSRRTRS